MTRSGCLLCGGYGSRHDPIAHDAEPTEYVTFPMDSDAPCDCGHKQRHHVAGRYRCPVVIFADGPPHKCDCPQFTEEAP